MSGFGDLFQTTRGSCGGTSQGTKTVAPAQASSVTQDWVRARLWFETRSPASTLVFSLPLYLFLTLVTVSTFLADTDDYASSIQARFQGKYNEFWEFGHILWRPTGWAITRSIGILSPQWVKTNAAHYHVILTLIVFSWLAGFATLYLFHRLACYVTRDFWCASLSTVGFATAQAFLNFVQAGTAYIAGLAMLMVAVCFLEVRYDPVRAVRISALGGIALAIAVLFWFPYVLVVPAVVLIPLLLHRALRDSLVTGISFAIVVGLVYLAVIVGLGLHSRAEILAWVREASHGIQIGGVARAVFGFARSFINMDEDGILFKRYLLHDPFSPVSLTDLLRTAIAKLALFYALLASVVAALVIAKRWHALALLSIASAPVLLFAVHWQGGDLERYLPFYPFLFLAIAICLSERSLRFQRLLSVTFIATMALVNTFALSRHANELQGEKIALRASDISPSLLNAAGVVYVTHTGDEFLNFARSFPFAPLNRRRSFHVLAIIEPGHSDLPMWKATFGRTALTAWERHGNVWVSQRVFIPVPKPEWNWVEHDDPRISWRDLSPFFSRLEYEQCVGGSDGFCLLAPSSANREFLASVSRSPT
jgi:hypothetical protein